MLPVLLLIDDEEEILEFLERMLQAKYTILKATGAAEGLSILRNTAVHLIVSDVMMPGMDGFELCRIVKSAEATSHIPLILLTAKNTLQSKISGLELMADAYIEKPFSKEHLLAQIASLLGNRVIVRDHFAGSPLAHIKGTAYSKSDELFLGRLHEVITQHIEDDDLDVEKLAGYMALSRITLYRRIKTISTLTPAELVSLTRLQKAAELLATGEYKVYEVALMVGFSSQSNFSRDFHRQFHMTPTEFAQSKQNKAGR